MSQAIRTLISGDKFRNFWKPELLKLFSQLYLFIVLLLCVLSLTSTFFGETLREGDYPAFYSAGEISKTSPQQLYDLELQKNIQEGIWGEKGFHVFAYPPFFAFPFILLSVFDPVYSKLLYVIFSFVLLISSSILLKRKFFYGELKKHRWYVSTSLLLLFFPFLIGVVSGQNTALSFLFLLLANIAFQSKRPLLLGLCVGMLNFKPQYALFVLLFYLLLEREKIRFLIAYVVMSLFQFFISVLYFGADIFFSWLKLMMKLGELNQGSIDNLTKISSLSGASKLILLNEPIFLKIALLVLLVFLMTMFLLETYKARKENILMYCVGGIVVFLSPQTGFYDSALILPLIFTLERYLSLSDFMWCYVLFCFLVFVAFMLQLSFYIPFLIFVLLGFYLFILRKERILVSS